jgi:hypothetical protein
MITLLTSFNKLSKKAAINQIKMPKYCIFFKKNASLLFSSADLPTLAPHSFKWFIKSNILSPPLVP